MPTDTDGPPHPFARHVAYFEYVWMMLCMNGHCDELGGREYQRVKAEWLRALVATEPEAFILKHANLPSSPGPLAGHN